MNPVQIYYDICKEIEIYEWRLEDLEGELKAIRKVMFTGEAPSDRPVHVPLDKALEQYDNVVERIREVSAELDRKKLIRNQIDRILRQLKGLDLKVAYMRDVENKPLKNIAKELGYSLDWIKKVSSRTKKAR